MKLKKTAAFIIALSMLVGLLSVFPASAITPVTGYAEEILVDESFDTDSYDKSLLKIENGNIADSSLNFDLVGKSGLALNASMDLAKTKQYIIDFELATDVTYTDPWTATFIGTRNVRAAEAPWDNINGTWLGITKDKLILWHSYEDCKWANETAAPGTHYTLVDNTFDVSGACQNAGGVSAQTPGTTSTGSGATGVNGGPGVAGSSRGASNSSPSGSSNVSTTSPTSTNTTSPSGTTLAPGRTDGPG